MSFSHQTSVHRSISHESSSHESSTHESHSSRTVIGGTCPPKSLPITGKPVPDPQRIEGKPVPVTKPAVKVTFDCYPPGTEATLKKHAGPFPFQKTITQNLQWAAAYLEHTNTQVIKQDKEVEDLTLKYRKALDTIELREDEIKKLKERNGQHEKRIKTLEQDNARQADLIVELRRKLKDAQDKAEKEEARLKKLLRKALSDLAKSRSDDERDHSAIERLTKELECSQEENAKLKTELKQKDEKLRNTEQALQKSKDAETRAQEEIKKLSGEIEKLKCDVADLKRQLARRESDLKQVTEERDQLIIDNSKLSLALQTEIDAHKATLAELRNAREKNATLQCKIDAHEKTIADLREQLKKSEQQLKDEQCRFRNIIKQKDEQIASHNATIKELNHRLSEILAALACAIEERDLARSDDEADKRKIRDAIEERDAARAARDKALADDAKDKQRIRDAEKERDDASKARDKALADDASDKKKIEDAEKKFKDAEENLKNARDDIDSITRERDHARKNDEEDRQTIENLRDRIKKMEARGGNPAECQNLKNLLDQLSAANEKVSEAQKDADKARSDDAQDKAAILAGEKKADEARKESQEAKDRAAAAEAKNKALEDKAKEDAALAKKPTLPNDCHLKNPIAVVGSLKGAPRSVDDETFYINCPFDVKLFGHSSSEIYVSTNGLLSLDSASKIYNYQKLPYLPWLAQGLPDHVLAPFWADLYIYKGTPQGIYYEVTGAEGSRKLEVEWYCSRYNNQNQYYHFSVILEENKPNVAVFKYFAANDKGAQCTIGVQGGNKGVTFAYNQAKVTPGVQVTFQTDKCTFAESKFAVAPVKASKVEDVKPSQAVTATVAEVIEVD